MGFSLPSTSADGCPAGSSGPWDAECGLPSPLCTRRLVSSIMIWWLLERGCGPEMGPEQRKEWEMRVPRGHLYFTLRWGQPGHPLPAASSTGSLEQVGILLKLGVRDVPAPSLCLL